MDISFDSRKRDRTLSDRGLDFERAPEIFAGRQVTEGDERKPYGEIRHVTVGYLDGRMVVLVWTIRGGTRRIISLRKANEREQAHYGAIL